MDSPNPLFALQQDHIRALLYLPKDETLGMPLPWTQRDYDCNALVCDRPDLCEVQFRRGGYEYRLKPAGVALQKALILQKKAARRSSRRNQQVGQYWVSCVHVVSKRIENVWEWWKQVVPQTILKKPMA